MNFKTLEHNEHDQINIVVNLFMRGPMHESVITHKHLEEAEVNIKQIDCDEIQNFADELIAECLNTMDELDTRVMFVSSKIFNVSEYCGENCISPGFDEAIYVCPLK